MYDRTMLDARPVTRAVAISILVTGIGGCVGGLQESYFQLKGAVEGGESNAECSLSLIQNETGAIQRTMSVAAHFKVDVTVPPKDTIYFVEVTCSGGAAFRSAGFSLGRSRAFGSEVDIGQLIAIPHKR
jgi:hypothetical protein